MGAVPFKQQQQRNAMMMDGMVEDYDYDMEEMAVEAPKAMKKAMMKEKMMKRKKREKIRELKRMVGMDPYENEDELDVTELEDTFMNILKFLGDPMVKSGFSKKDYKTVQNATVDAASVLERMENTKEKSLLVKV